MRERKKRKNPQNLQKFDFCPQCNVNAPARSQSNLVLPIDCKLSFRFPSESDPIFQFHPFLPGFGRGEVAGAAAPVPAESRQRPHEQAADTEMVPRGTLARRRRLLRNLFPLGFDAAGKRQASKTQRCVGNRDYSTACPSRTRKTRLKNL